MNFRPSHDCRFFFSKVIEPIADAPDVGLGEVWVGMGNDNSGLTATDEIAPVDGAPSGEIAGTGTGVIVKFACIEGAATVFCSVSRPAGPVEGAGGFVVVGTAFMGWVVEGGEVPIT